MTEPGGGPFGSVHAGGTRLSRPSSSACPPSAPASAPPSTARPKRVDVERGRAGRKREY